MLYSLPIQSHAVFFQADVTAQAKDDLQKGVVLLQQGGVSIGGLADGREATCFGVVTPPTAICANLLRLEFLVS